MLKLTRRFYRFHSSPWLFWALFLLVYLPVLSFFLVSLSIVILIFWPWRQLDVPALAPEMKENLILISHGVNDSNRSWASELQRVMQRRHPEATVIALDWEQYADNVFTCAVNGKRIGEKLAKQLRHADKLKKIHLIGHSCGSFINYGLCRELKGSSTNVRIETTYLDPTSVYGGLFWHYGLSHFGSCADISEHYYDTDDRVPGSNQPLAYGKSYNVTELKAEYGYSGNPHLWPVYYYLRKVDE